MKRYFVLIVLVLIIFSISGCSSEPNLELMSSKATIVNDKNITGSIIVTEGEKREKSLLQQHWFTSLLLKIKEIEK